MSIALPPWDALAVFMGTVLIVFMVVVAASGHFPREWRAGTLATVAGTAILWLTIAITAATALGAIAFAWALIPWYAAVIGAGLMILVAPYALHPLPDRIVNGPSVLVTLACLAVIADLGMWHLAWSAH